MNTNTQTPQQLLKLAKYAFHKPVTGGDEAFYALLKFAQAYTHTENDQLTSMVIDIPFQVYWKDESLKMSGIGYVASYPEYRGNGAIRELMTQILREEYAKGTALSYLAPFSYAFYKKFGYAYTFDRKHYQLPAHQFPQGQKTTGQIFRTTLEESQNSLAQLHAKAYNQGSLVRESHIWQYYFHFKSQPYFAIYQENHEDLGYLIYEFNGQSFVIREIVALTDDAKQAIYRFISSHASSFDTIEWTATSHEKLEEDLAEPATANITLQPYMMSRIVNLPAFLAANGTPDFSCEIVDDIIPENNLIIGSDPQMKLSIGEFTAKILKNNSAILREYF